jgi:hypothetical protein
MIVSGLTTAMACAPITAIWNNDDLKLLPGMPAEAFIQTQERTPLSLDRAGLPKPCDIFG